MRLRAGLGNDCVFVGRNMSSVNNISSQQWMTRVRWMHLKNDENLGKVNRQKLGGWGGPGSLVVKGVNGQKVLGLNPQWECVVSNWHFSMYRSELCYPKAWDLGFPFLLLKVIKHFATITTKGLAGLLGVDFNLLSFGFNYSPPQHVWFSCS